MDNMRMDKRVTEYLAWLDNQFENALDASDSDAPSEYQEGLTDGFDRAEAAFRRIFDVKENDVQETGNELEKTTGDATDFRMPDVRRMRGCGRSDTGDEVRHIGLPVGRDYHRLQGYDYSRLRECRINLHDGRQVTCLILSGDIRSGMSCDWANATEETDK